MRSKLKQVDIREKTHLIGVGLSNILITYALVDTIQPTKFANSDNSISRASNVAGVT